MQQHIYTSSKGENFLSWDEWANTTLSPTDLEVYMGEYATPDKLALYARWVEEEGITSHVVMEDGEQVQRTDF
jgi:antirestriction protein